LGEKEILEFSQRYARSRGFRLNPDTQLVAQIIRGLVENEKKYGFRYCPCRALTSDPKVDREKICPCKWHYEEIEERGHCLCGLFVRG
jgi:ferredoxin-thioredoxin reductase catalytic subunit